MGGTPFPLVKVMYDEMNLNPQILGQNYNGEVLGTGIYFFLNSFGSFYI